MNIGIDIRPALKAKTGVGNYVSNLVSALVELDRATGTTLDRNGIQLGDAFNGSVSKMPTPPFSVRGFTRGNEGSR